MEPVNWLFTAIALTVLLFTAAGLAVEAVPALM